MVEILDVSSLLANQFEPKRKFRWVLAIEGIDAFLLKTAQRPTFTNEATEISWINATRYVAGKFKFNPITITLHDPIAPSGAQQITEWIRLHHEHVSQRAGYKDFYARNIQLKLLDGLGSVVELWDAKGCLITETNFGDLDYNTNDLVEISITIQADLWVLQY